MTRKEAIKLLLSMTRDHEWADSPWQCGCVPRAESPFGIDPDGVCVCGAEEHNRKLNMVIKFLQKEVGL